MWRRLPLFGCILSAALLAALNVFPVFASYTRQGQNAPGKSDSDKSAPDTRAKPQPPQPVTIHIEVTGGAKNKPVENASIYVRYNEAHKYKSDKLIEMNVKTSLDGKVKVPLVPKGKILIQVVAQDWKTYGRWFDLTEDGQVFKIHLDRPSNW